MPKKQNSSVEREMIFLRQMKEKMEKIVDKESKYSYLDMLKQNTVIPFVILPIKIAPFKPFR